MCSYCQDVLIGFAIPHPKNACPLLRSSYCSVCCSKGHLTEECPDREVLETRVVQFVEQLVPYSLIQHYNIKTHTHLHQTNDIRKARFEPVLEVEDTDKAIRAILMNNDIQPSGKMKVNRQKLQQIATDQGRKLVYLKPK